MPVFSISQTVQDMANALPKAIGEAEAATVFNNPTLAFRFAVGLHEPDLPAAHAQLDTICQHFGGMVEQRHEDTTVPNYDVVLFTTLGGAMALASDAHVKGLRLQVEFADPTHIRAINLGKSKRSYAGSAKAKTSIPYQPPFSYD